MVNEAGGSTEIATSHADLYTLPNGCFTCQDEAVLQKALGDLAEGGTQIVIMEGFGIVSGDETKTFLSQVPYPHAIIGVLDVANWTRNLVNYGELLPTHLTVADGVVATKHDSDTLPAVVQEFLSANQVRSPVTRGPVDQFPEGTWPVVQAALERRRAPVAGHDHSGHGHDDGHHDHGHHDHDHSHHHHEHDHSHHHHDHDHHHHDHDHGHGWMTTVLDLGPKTTLTELQAVTQEMVSAGKLRLKGRLRGPPSMSPRVRPTGSSEPPSLAILVICYLPEDTDWPVDLLNLVASPPEPARAHELLRVDTDRAATVSALEEGVAAIRSWSPQTVSLPDGSVQLVTHPERLQIYKEMSRRPGVRAEWFVPVMTACLEYWVSCAEWLDAHRSEVGRAHLPTHQRELGVSLAWWTLEFVEMLPQALVRRVYAIQPATLIATGLSEVSALRADSFWRYWQGLEYLRGLRFGLERLSESDQAVVRDAAERVLSMAQSDEERSAFDAEFRARPSGSGPPQD